MIPQYARSTDPEVIAAVEAAEAVRHEAHLAALDWVRQHGNPEDPAYYGGATFEGFVVHAIACNHKPTMGEWTRGYAGRGWRPFKSNPLYQEMTALGRKIDPVPGVPDMVDSIRNPDGSGHWLSPNLFVHDGAAWLSYSMTPAPKQRQEIGPQWTEVLASEYLGAREAYNASKISVPTT